MPKREVGKKLQKVTDEHLALVKKNAKTAGRNRRSALFQRIAANPLPTIFPNESDDINDGSGKKD